jgi:uncharacterized integral membrane protein
MIINDLERLIAQDHCVESKINEGSLRSFRTVSMHFLLSCLIGLIIIAAALLSVQNATAITIQFLFWQSISLPFGVVLAFAISSGVLLVTLIRPTAKLAATPADEFDFEDWE